MKMHRAVDPAAVLMQSDSNNPTQRTLDNLQQRQEQAVNAGHRPDRAVNYIIALETLRHNVVQADIRLSRALLEAENRAAEYNDSVLHERKI